MSTWEVHSFAQANPSACCHDEEDVVEIPLLLPNWQAEALENAAHQQGLTAGEMIRHLLQEFLDRKVNR